MKLLIVEDEAAIRESLVDYFAGRSVRVDAVASSEAAAEVLADHDAVLLDLALPGRDGIEWLRELRASGNRTPVLIMTARGEEEQRIAGLQAEADDYVVKPFSVRELEARIHAVLRRVAGGPSDRVVRIGDAEIDLEAHEVRLAGTTHRLLLKEVELLRYLLQNPDVAHDRGVLLQEVWGYDACPTTRTVDTHVLNLRKKIEPVPDQPEHLLTVHRVGYRLVL